MPVEEYADEPVARPCPGCGRELQPPAGVRWYQPAADSEPGPMVTAVAPYGMSPALWRFMRQADGGWKTAGPLPDSYISAGLIQRVPDAEPTPWHQVGQCPSKVSHPVVAVHRNNTGQWVCGIAPGSVRKESLRLAANWFTPHALHQCRCAHDVDAGGGS
jgi:hypothetical protein